MNVKYRVRYSKESSKIEALAVRCPDCGTWLKFNECVVHDINEKVNIQRIYDTNLCRFVCLKCGTEFSNRYVSINCKGPCKEATDYFEYLVYNTDEEVYKDCYEKENKMDFVVTNAVSESVKTVNKILNEGKQLSKDFHPGDREISYIYQYNLEVYYIKIKDDGKTVTKFVLVGKTLPITDLGKQVMKDGCLKKMYTDKKDNTEIRIYTYGDSVYWVRIDSDGIVSACDVVGKTLPEDSLPPINDWVRG